MRLAALVQISEAVAASAGRLDKICRIAALLASVPDFEIETAVSYLAGAVRQSRTGVGYAMVASASDALPANDATLEIDDVDQAFIRIAAQSGKGSAAVRTEELRRLFARATSSEQQFLRKLISGELRQGALEGVMTDAIAKAAGVPAAAVRRAAMIAGDLPTVARLALTTGAAALDAIAIRLMSPVSPMLADSADSIDEALAEVEDASIDYKIDGARIQAHKDGGDVRIFSRTLNDVTASVPDIVSVVAALSISSAILDGEAILLEPGGRPRPFQETMRRFGRRRDVERERVERPLTPFFFDVLYADGAPLIDEPFEQRAAVLGGLAGEWAVPRVTKPTPDEARAFVAGALARGHEGVMVKSLASPYAAGRRGSAWLKVKQARTLDVVVLAAEWGHGRRRGWLSNLHLGARDPAHGAFVMLGKTFKGMTDQMLAWQTEQLLAREIGREGITVHVRPELVVEIAFNEIQVSPVYPGGLALRFARVIRYRDDKSAAQADTIDTVRSMAGVKSA